MGDTHVNGGGFQTETLPEAGQAREGKAAPPSERRTKEERQHCRGETAGERGELRACAAPLDLGARSSESPRIVRQLAPAGRCRSRPETIVLHGIVERRASVPYADLSSSSAGSPCALQVPSSASDPVRSALPVSAASRHSPARSSGSHAADAISPDTPPG